MNYQISRINVLGFECLVIDTKPCDQTLEHDPIHDMYLVLNPNGVEEWVCEWLTTS